MMDASDPAQEHLLRAERSSTKFDMLLRQHGTWRRVGWLLGFALYRTSPNLNTYALRLRASLITAGS